LTREAQPTRHNRRWLIAALLIAGFAVSYPIWFRALGGYLVHADQPFQADIAVVLAGDSFGHRILKGADMVRGGFTGKVLVSGPEGMYGYNEAELAIPFAVRLGNPSAWFIASPNKSRSTREEAQAIAPELRKLAVRKCLLVTSNYHTRRAGRLFRWAAPGVEFRVIAARDEFYDPNNWWRTREARKCFVLEWSKTIASWFGI
jgi:uncharacterized SAM-binding protein YcdF (DUF218 family)